jgi:hypothetical protein
LDCSSHLLFISHGENFDYSSNRKSPETSNRSATYYEHIGFTNKGTIPWCQVTVGPKCGKDKLMQAVERMRQLGKGQSLEFIASPEATGRWQCVKTNSTPVVHIKIAGKWMFIPLKMVLIGIDPYPCNYPILSSFIVELFVLGELSF